MGHGEDKYSTGYAIELDWIGCFGWRNRLEDELPGTTPTIIPQKWLAEEMTPSTYTLGT